MKAFVFHSVHERLFHAMAAELSARHGVEEFSGFVWGRDQLEGLSARPSYSPLTVFTRDVLPRAASRHCTPGAAREIEKRLGVPLQRMIWSERHLLEGRTHQQVLDLCLALYESAHRLFDRAQADFAFSEDVSCLSSYMYWSVARQREIPFYCIGDARIRYRVSVYRDLQEWRHTTARFEELRRRGLDETQREVARSYLRTFRDKPVRPAGMERRAKLPVATPHDATRLLSFSRRYRIDPSNPTLEAPHVSLGKRVRRLARSAWLPRTNLFETPPAGEPYVLFPIHFQPEASTLVLAPMYLDQVTLIENISKSLPAGCRLYVKEHISNRGRRPLSFYQAIKSIPGVRLLGPQADTWSLIKHAAAIAVITGTMGWEGLIFRRPVITFGQVFFNGSGQVYEGRKAALDDWPALFEAAVERHRHDEDALEAFVVAMHETSHDGFMRNASSFPEVLEPDNVEKLTDALMHEVRLRRPVWEPQAPTGNATTRPGKEFS